MSLFLAIRNKTATPTYSSAPSYGGSATGAPTTGTANRNDRLDTIQVVGDLATNALKIPALEATDVAALNALITQRVGQIDDQLTNLVILMTALVDLDSDDRTKLTALQTQVEDTITRLNRSGVKNGVDVGKSAIAWIYPAILSPLTLDEIFEAINKLDPLPDNTILTPERKINAAVFQLDTLMSVPNPAATAAQFTIAYYGPADPIDQNTTAVSINIGSTGRPGENNTAISITSPKANKVIRTKFKPLVDDWTVNRRELYESNNIFIWRSAEQWGFLVIPVLL